ncbi:uncharacterized protein LOC111687852 [Lucilia cuprina]|uniref:uncharacterized protein LOC111687852 n=1 Tax=Lucilia cuprina TaxID=7375 RepID=UPI001F0592DE|nr:uncharacterized protein LOC111687852 [Lucilia cuprina]
MRGYLLAVAFVATLAITAAIDEECVERKLRGLPVHWPNPTDCSSFYRCTNKNIKRELLCPEGKEYNPKTGRCGNKGKNLCRLSLIAPLAAAVDNPCADEVSGTFVADPKSCRSYMICNNNLAYPQTCDAGSFFKTDLSACVPDTQTECWENLCVKKANGVYVKNANDCHSFYVCNNEKAVAQNCPTGSYFNDKSLNCQPGKCPSEEVDTTTHAPETTTPLCEVETTTTCAAPKETTTCATETTTPPCEVETTTTCAAPDETTTCAMETTTPYCEAETTTTCAAEEETTTLANDEDDCSTLNCDTTKCQNVKDGFVYPALNTNAGFCVCQKQKPQYRECPNDAIYHQNLQICVTQDKVCPSSECLQKPDYATFPASNTTTGFCRCLDGLAAYFDCVERDFIYSETLGFCVKAPSSNGDDCEEETEKLCPGGYSEGDFVPHPNNCMLFYICYEGELVESSCEPGNYFDDEIKACLRDTQGKCPECQVTQTSAGNRRNRRSARAPICVEGVKSAANNCTQYYKCVGGQRLLYGCGRGNFFNPITLTCEFDANHLCPDVASCVNGQKTVYLMDKEKYYECVNGRQELKSCDENSYFNKLSLTCVANEECTCPGGYKEGQISAHPDDCDKFYICIAGEQMIHECGKGNYFDKDKLSCEKDVKNICNIEKPCQCPGGYEEGELSPHPKDCDKFYICVDGKQVLQECGENNYFNNYTKTCEPDIYNECWTKTPCTCPGGYEEGDFSAHPTECNKYYICHDGHQVLEDCGTNNRFNNDTLTCEPDTDHVCWPNLCAGQANGALVGNPQQCNTFFLCENEQAIPQSCYEGQYFNTTTHACEADLEAECYKPCENENAGPIKLLPHPICNKYYFCNGRNTHVGTCDVGSFDIETGICDATKKCFPNPCDNLPPFAAFPDPYDPTKFYICKDKKPIPMKCLDGMEFDHELKLCVKVSDPDCDTCTKDGTYPTLNVGNDYEFCVCVDGISTKIECPKDSPYNSEVGICYSNAPCDPTFCLNNKDYEVSENRNDTKSFCMCIDEEPIIVSCPNNGTFNPYIKKCSEYESSPKCLQSMCVDPKNNLKTFNPIDPKKSNGVCVCRQQIATYEPCSYGSTLNTELTICQLAEINCNSYQCRDLPDKTKIQALTTYNGYCECVKGIATYYNCPNNGEFNVNTEKCETPICDLTKCEIEGYIPASNTTDGYCDCKTGSYKSCPDGEKFGKFGICKPPCVNLLCSGKPDQYLIPSTVNDHSFCICQVGTQNASYEECNPKSYLFDETKQMCVANSAELCGTDECGDNLGPRPAIDTTTGFCLCTQSQGKPVYTECLQGIYDDSKKTCIKTAKDVCDIRQCAGATMEQPITLPSNQSNAEFCYCSSPTDAMLLNCPNYKYYNHAKGMCVSQLSDDCKNGQTQQVEPTCNEYKICLDGKWQHKTCPAGEYFDDVRGYCCLDTEGVCEKKSDCTCLGAYYENEHLPHPINKHMYYVCKDGMLHEHKCPAHRIFSVTQKQCVRGKHPDLTSMGLPQKRSLDFDNEHEFGCLENDKRSVPSNCSQYEICQQQIWQRKTCSNYRYYNPEQKKCLEPRDDFVCTYAKVTSLPSCDASRELQLYQAKTCHQYYRCQEGKWRLKNCGRQQYFNNKKATCLPLPDEPGFQCSNQTLGREENVITSCQHLTQRYYAKNCAMFLLCLDNDWWYQYCPEGMFYNRTLNYCVPDVKQQCKDVIKANVLPIAEEYTRDKCQQDGLLRPSAMACNRYFVCVNGKWQMQHCGQREYYDASNAKCSTDNEGVCKNLHKDCLASEKRSVPRNCSAYEQCSSEGKWLKFNCPTDEIYDELTQRCIKNQGICSKHGFKRACRLEETMPFKGNCSRFYYCSEDSWYLGNCAKGFMFSQEKRLCVAHTLEDQCQPLEVASFGNSQSESGLCFDKPDGTSVAHSQDCTRYYICIQQTTSHEMQCSKGSYFEPTLGYCRPNDGSCRLPLTGVCANATDESLVANPTDCQSYYKCSSINGTELLFCPDGQYFHNQTHECRLDQGECRKVIKPVKKCSGFAHGTRLAHEKYCNIYYACVKGLAIPVECPDNYQFNALLGKCMPDLEHTCQDGQLVEGNITYSCANQTDGSYLADLKDCTRYYICSQGEALPKKCGNASYFNSELLLCVPDDGSCPFVTDDNGQQNPVAPDPLMCEGKHGYLLADPFNCNNFYACVHNKLKHERCYDQQFFNTSILQCQPKLSTETSTNSNTTSVDINLITSKTQNPQCLDETTSIHKLCSELGQGTALAEQGDCRRYITCQEPEEEPVSQRCRNGESFDSLLGFCRQNDGTCLLENGQRVGECSGKHGQLARDPKNCRNYFVCINGQKIAQTCQADEYFDKSLNMCMQDTQKVCNPTQTPEEPQKQSCTGLSESVLYPYVQDNCRSYFQCIQGVAKIHKCADDLYFDPLSIKCVKNKTECIMPTNNLKRSPTVTQTFSKLCSNKKLEYPYANVDNECRSFYICHNNGDISQELCPLGMIFNKELLTCTVENNTKCK